MRIAYLTPTSIFSGGEKVTLDIAKAMQRRGFEVAYYGMKGVIQDVVEKTGIPFICLDSFSTKHVCKALRLYKPDLVHCMDFRATTYAAISGFPFIAHLHNNPPWLKGYGPNAWAMLFFCLRAKAVITVSHSVFGEFCFSRLFTSDFIARRIHMVSNCVDIKEVKRKSKEHAPIHQTFDVAFIGRFLDQKRPEAFVSCVRQIKKSYPGLKAVMLGEGELMETVKTLIDEYELNNTITLVGHQENPFPWLAASKLLIMPSAWEGFGLVAVEALALGKPVVACAVGGLKDIVDDSCGALCNDVNSLASAAACLLMDSERYSEASGNAAQRAQKYNKFEKYYNTIEHLYRS